MQHTIYVLLFASSAVYTFKVSSLALHAKYRIPRYRLIHITGSKVTKPSKLVDSASDKKMEAGNNGPSQKQSPPDHLSTAMYT